MWRVALGAAILGACLSVPTHATHAISAGSRLRASVGIAERSSIPRPRTARNTARANARSQQCEFQATLLSGLSLPDSASAHVSTGSAPQINERSSGSAMRDTVDGAVSSLRPEVAYSARTCASASICALCPGERRQPTAANAVRHSLMRVGEVAPSSSATACALVTGGRTIPAQDGRKRGGITNAVAGLPSSDYLTSDSNQSRYLSATRGAAAYAVSPSTVRRRRLIRCRRLWTTSSLSHAAGTTHGRTRNARTSHVTRGRAQPNAVCHDDTTVRIRESGGLCPLFDNRFSSLLAPQKTVRRSDLHGREMGIGHFVSAHGR